MVWLIGAIGQACKRSMRGCVPATQPTPAGAALQLGLSHEVLTAVRRLYGGHWCFSRQGDAVHYGSHVSNPFLAGILTGAAYSRRDSVPAEPPVFAGPVTAGETFTFTNVTGLEHT